MLIPGFIISIITFPGVIVHEIAHQLFCRICRVAVLDVCYFRFGNPAGYVVHEHPKSSYQHILIGIGPFFINTIVGALIALPAAVPILSFGHKLGGSNIIDYVLIWLGVSVAMHSFPSTGDAKSLWKTVKDKETPIIAKLFIAPIVLLIYIGALGSVVWLDLIYGVAVATFIPNLIINILA
ncbi:metalloprotease family protein [Desnuesiella massiliensis]|uniref:metalloprotease family protein n=1 Tax=Desnuesiella massiliensis TaxID=1650662 RepID=UPI0006E4090B|nr:metalloprotease family protein [Desnuesiella massiliensis]